MQPNRRWRREALLPLLLLVVALAGCATGPPPPVSSAELAYAETFPFFKLYWAGRTFAGFAVTAVGSLYSYTPKAGESVYYGSCKPRVNPLGAGLCRLPLEVTTLVYTPHTNGRLGLQRNLLLRGVPAVSYEQERAFILYTGHLEVRVVAATATLAREGVAALEPLNATGSAREPLPPPTFCPSLEGPLPAPLAQALGALPGQPCQHSHLLEVGEP